MPQSSPLNDKHGFFKTNSNQGLGNMVLPNNTVRDGGFFKPGDKNLPPKHPKHLKYRGRNGQQ